MVRVIYVDYDNITTTLERERAADRHRAGDAGGVDPVVPMMGSR
jgi:hypothetical protein